MDKLRLKQVLISNQKEVERYRVIPRRMPDDAFACRIFVGVRRAGKSFMLFQKMQELLSSGFGWESMLYLNFEDDRLAEFSFHDFDLILESHAEMYGTRPRLFLDEIQIVPGWERFARRMADAKHSVWITGSNAKMLSSEMMTTLGGRYLIAEVYPYNFKEYLHAQQVPHDHLSLLALESRAKVEQHWNEYLLWGGLPESASLPVKRDYLSSVFQKIYLGDIAARSRLSSQATLRLLLKKMAEAVGRPIAYNRLAHLLSSTGSKVTMPTVAKYIELGEAAWLLLRVRNVLASFATRETHCKYYFIDNGVLNLFLLGGEAMLLENMVALALLQRYGHDTDNERVFFYHDKVEVDFYIPDDMLAIQVCYNMSRNPDTLRREAGALAKLPKVLPCERRLIITCEEQYTISDQWGSIEVIPAWQWLLEEDCRL